MSSSGLGCWVVVDHRLVEDQRQAVPGAQAAPAAADGDSSWTTCQVAAGLLAVAPPPVATTSRASLPLRRCTGPAASSPRLTDLSWQLLDRGWDIRYSPEVTVTHPTTTPRRHEMAARLTARNRVWLARRNLPWPLALTYVAVWVTITAVRKSFPRSEEHTSELQSH